MLRIEINTDEIAEELSLITKRNGPSSLLKTSRNSMTKALRSGRELGRKKLGTRLRPPNGLTWTVYYRKGVKAVQPTQSGDDTEGYLRVSSKTRGLRRYTSQTQLDRHRRQANQHRPQFRRPRPRYATPLKFEIIPGQKFSLERTFVGKGKGKSGQQVFRRPRNPEGDIRRPVGPSLANQLRSQRNTNIRNLMRNKIRDVYTQEYKRQVRLKFKRASKRANKKFKLPR